MTVKLIESLVCENIQVLDGEKHLVTIEYQDGSDTWCWDNNYPLEMS